MKTEMNGLVLRVAGGGRRNTDSRQTKAFQAPACVAASAKATVGRYWMCEETKAGEERK